MKKIRQPIVSVLGHVDHGKTSILDKIRGSNIYGGEAGGITQHIGASEIPIDTVKKICGSLLDKMKINVSIPGLLFIDTPGHEAFTTLRKRGGSIADLAVLVIDINKGLQPQTEESLLFLKEFKTPFVIAANKIDRILGWTPYQNECFINTIKEQQDRAIEDLENKIYSLIGQLAQKGLNAERYDRISDFRKQIAIVPTSAITGEGISDLLVVLSGLAEKYLKDNIVFESGEGKGTVLEVKEYKGLGMTIDVILYNGEIKKGDILVIGGNTIVETKIKALLKPEPLKDIRTEKQFKYIDSVVAASGVKISAPGLESVIAGSPLRTIHDQKDVDKVKTELKKEVQEIEIHRDTSGVIIRADTLGGLEAMIKILQEKNIPIRKAEVGNVTKQDVMEISQQKEPIIFAFNSQVPEDIKLLAKDYGITIFSSKIIYQLIEEYDKWKEDQKKISEEKILEEVTRPGKVRLLPGCVFRQSKPAIFGVEVVGGTIRSGYKLIREGKILEEIKKLQKDGKNIDELVAGDRGAISMNVIVGKHVFEGDTLEVKLEPKDIRLLNKVKNKLRDDEKQLLEEIENRAYID